MNKDNDHSFVSSVSFASLCGITVIFHCVHLAGVAFESGCALWTLLSFHLCRVCLSI